MLKLKPKGIAFVLILVLSIFLLSLGGIFALILTNTKPITVTKIPIVPDDIHIKTTGKGVTYTKTQAGLTIDVKVGNEYVSNQNNQAYVQVNLAATGELESQVKRPLNLSLVIDRSGSMSGSKLDNVKQALKKLADYLDSDDKVALVIYDTNVEVLFSGKFDKEQFLAKVDTIYAGASTNLEGGLLKGLESYIDYSLISLKPGTYPHYQKLILLSDGLANVGRSTPEELASITKEKARNMLVTTIGVGTDYDENIMTSIARAGRGNYYFMEDPNQAKTIFEEELKRSTQIIVEDIKVDMNLNPIYEINRGIGYELNNKTTFKPLDMYSGKKASYLLELNRIAEVQKDKVTLGEVRVSYFSRLTNKTETMIIPVEIQVIEEKINPLADIEMYKEYMLSYMAEQLWKVDEYLQKQQNDDARSTLDSLLTDMQSANTRMDGAFDSELKSINTKQEFLKNLGTRYINDTEDGRSFKKDNQNESYQQIYGK